jgi:hypothetical protein
MEHSSRTLRSGDDRRETTSYRPSRPPLSAVPPIRGPTSHLRLYLTMGPHDDPSPAAAAFVEVKVVHTNSPAAPAPALALPGLKMAAALGLHSRPWSTLPASSCKILPVSCTYSFTPRGQRACSGGGATGSRISVNASDGCIGRSIRARYVQRALRPARVGTTRCARAAVAFVQGEVVLANCEDPLVINTKMGVSVRPSTTWSGKNGQNSTLATPHAR